jgi:hypothetical protein
MQVQRTPLHVLSIERPCHQDWNDMSPAASGRFCAHCQRQVHDLKQMTAAQVDDLICRSAGPFCVRYQAMPDGRVNTLDYQPANARSRRWFILAIPAAIASIATTYLGYTRGGMRVRTMGMVCPTSRPGRLPAASSQPTADAPAAATEFPSDVADE